MPLAGRSVNLYNFFISQFVNIFSEFKMHISFDLGCILRIYLIDICHKEIYGKIFIAGLFIATPTKHTHTLMAISRKLNYANYIIECHAVVKRAG